MALKSLYRGFIRNIKDLPKWIRIKKQYIGEKIEVNRMISSKPVNNIQISKQDSERIKAYWKKIYGKEISTKWHRKYYGYSGKLDIQFFPEILYTTKLEPLLNPEYACEVLSDKSLIEFLYNKAITKDNHIIIPKTICGCSNGAFYDGERNPVDRDRIIQIFKTIDRDVIIKPTVGESSGRGVKLLSMSKGVDSISGLDAEHILDDYGKNFIVQEKIIEHSSYKALHPESINTVRVMTYRKDGEIKHAPIIMRIGVGNTFLDNAHAGGLYISVSDDGYLGQKALRNYSDPLEIHPDTGIVFEGYHLPYFDRIIDAAIQLHKCLPNLYFVNWDLCVDEEGNTVLIECNMRCGSIWLFQNAWGKSVFGADTEYMAALIKK